MTKTAEKPRTVENNDAKDRKRKCCLVYVGSVKDLIGQK